MGLLKSIGNVVKTAGKIGASMYTGGGSLEGGNVNDMFKNGLSNIVNGAVGLGQDQLSAQQQWEYQKKASDYAFNQNLQMWNMVNAYNDPSAQMERLQKAKLNPNLVYGGGNATGNTSGSGPTYERPGGGFVDRSIQREQLALALKEHQQRVTNQAIENDLARQRLVLSEREADRSDALALAQIQAYKANLGLTGANIERINNDNNYSTYDRWFNDYKEAHKDWLARRSDVARRAKYSYEIVNWEREHPAPKPPVHKNGVTYRHFGRYL